MKAYLDYFDVTERKGWRLTDLPWDQLDLDKVTAEDRAAVLATSVIESGVPHYSRIWALVDGFYADWELAQFVTLWAGEEERHNVALNRLAMMLGQGAAAGMLTYAMVQEVVTWKFYSSVARQTKSRLIREALGKIGEDEMRHHVWYREALKARYSRATDKVGFSNQVVEAVRHFHMPHSIFHVQEGFFDSEAQVVGKLGFLDIKMKVARALSFDPSVIARLVRTRVEDHTVAGKIGAPLEA
jgi:hypothetical protein